MKNETLPRVLVIFLTLFVVGALSVLSFSLYTKIQTAKSQSKKRQLLIDVEKENADVEKAKTSLAMKRANAAYEMEFKHKELAQKALKEIKKQKRLEK